jgi:predicted pyridoxine 5'-phosphate oxidase superfamily flavin-nucleotide-binding protein
LARGKVSPFLDDMAQDFIRQAPFAVLATASETGDCDASPKGGRPGFFKVLDEKRLLIPDIAGNKLFQSYENLETNPKAGLVFLIPGCDWTVRVNGRASVVHAEDAHLANVAPETFHTDDNTKVLQGMLLEVDEAYAHCPRAFLFSKLWDTGRIEEARGADSNRYWYGRWREAREKS